MSDISPAHKPPALLSVLREIAQAMQRRGSQRELLHEVLQVLERDLEMHRATVMLVSLDGGSLVTELIRGDARDELGEAMYQRGEGITGQVLESARPAVIPRISEEPRFKGRLHSRGHSEREELSFICVPILIEDEVVGTLAVDLPWTGEESLQAYAQFLDIVACMVANHVNSRRIARLERQSLMAENLRLREALGENFRPANMIGNTRVMQEVYQRIHQVAGSDTTVLIRGESGTGKELVASAIHYLSLRSRKPFVAVNCAQLSENLVESELFGHERGAFTGALSARMGRLEEAEGGTIFFDEIGDFSPPIQIKLLRVLQQREYQRVGANKTHKADVRIVAATNRNLETAVGEQLFRQDLYYRVNVFPIALPPLRERQADIPALADHFARHFSEKMGKPLRRISTTAINMMLAYHWPGNVRELENCIEYAMLLSSDGVIHGQNLPPTLQMPLPGGEAPLGGTLKARTQLLEKDMIVDALKRHAGRVGEAASELGISPRMLRYKMKNLGIDHRAFRPGK